MNKTIALAAITLVAVVMGMSALAPAAMASPNSGEGSHNPKVKWCHFDRDVNDDGIVEAVGSDDRQWEVKLLNKHAAEAHDAHGDLNIETGEVAEGDCNKGFLGDPDDV